MEQHPNIGIPIADVLNSITTLASPDRSVIVGIDGGAGAGKTTFTYWFAEAMKESVNSVSIVHMDSFCRPSQRRRKDHAVVPDLDWRRLRDQVLLPLHAGKAARFQLYDWPEDRLKDWITIDIGGVVIVDGVSVTRRELSSFYDLRIWFVCPRNVRESRLMRRGDTPAKAIRRWIPSEEQYVACHTPDEQAHLVIDSTADMGIDGGIGWSVRRWSPPSVI